MSNALQIEMYVMSRRKNLFLAYLTWWFGLHYFYLGRPLRGIVHILSLLMIVGFIIHLADFFLLPGMVKRHSDKTREYLNRFN